MTTDKALNAGLRMFNMFQMLQHLKKYPVFNNMKLSIWSISNSVNPIVYKVVAPVGFTLCLVMTLLPLCISYIGQSEGASQKAGHH